MSLSRLEQSLQNRMIASPDWSRLCPGGDGEDRASFARDVFTLAGTIHRNPRLDILETTKAKVNDENRAERDRAF